MRSVVTGFQEQEGIMEVDHWLFLLFLMLLPLVLATDRYLPKDAGVQPQSSAVPRHCVLVSERTVGERNRPPSILQ